MSGWLVHYNSLSATLWFVVLTNTIYFSIWYGQPQFFVSTNVILTIIQSLALIEVINAAIGVVKAPVMTTAIQVASRMMVVVGIFQVLPHSKANFGHGYITLSLAWSVTEIIRYSFYAINLETNGNCPDFLAWLRYSTFIALYPLGISSECWLIYGALDEAAVLGEWYRWFLIAVLAIYVPGSYVMYTYMMKQRKKVLTKRRLEKERIDKEKEKLTEQEKKEKIEKKEKKKEAQDKKEEKKEDKKEKQS